MPTLYTVIRRPLITEKGMAVKETQNTLVFEVALKATKTEVKQAVETLFKVKVSGVRTRLSKEKSVAVASSPATAPTGRRLMFASKRARRCRSIWTASNRRIATLAARNRLQETKRAERSERRQGNKDDADQIISTDYSITPLRDEARQRRHHDGQAA